MFILLCEFSIIFEYDVLMNGSVECVEKKTEIMNVCM
jgi:hypothetical protein